MTAKELFEVTEAAFKTWPRSEMIKLITLGQQALARLVQSADSLSEEQLVHLARFSMALSCIESQTKKNPAS